MAIKLYYWESDDIINQPSTRKKKVFGSESEVQNLLTRITGYLPDILNSDNELNESNIQACKSAYRNLETYEKSVRKLQVWEDNRDKITNFLEDKKNALETSMDDETDDDVKDEIEDKIKEVDKILNDLSGLSLEKAELINTILERIDTYGYGKTDTAKDFSDFCCKDDYDDLDDWQEIVGGATSVDFATTQSFLLKSLAELIIDHWLTIKFTKSEIKLGQIEAFIEATKWETETQEVIEETNRKAALTRLKKKVASQKGTFTFTILGKAQALDPKNESDNRSIILPFEMTKITAAFDLSAFGKLTGIEKTNHLQIFYNGADDESAKTTEFNETWKDLENWENRKVVIKVDKLDDDDRTYVRIETADKRIDLDWDSYSEITFSGGRKLAEDWGVISSDFNTTPYLKKNWTNLLFTYNKVKEWVDIGLKPTEHKLAAYLVKKGGNYKNPEWVNDNVDEGGMLTLRKDFLRDDIEKRLNKYSTSGFNAAELFEKHGGKDGVGHWGSDDRGKTWQEFWGKIDNYDGTSDTCYQLVAGGLLAALNEVLLPEFILRNLAKNMVKKDIVRYLEDNCFSAELTYYDNVDGRIEKSKDEGGTPKWTVRQVVDRLTYNG